MFIRSSEIKFCAAGELFNLPANPMVEIFLWGIILLIAVMKSFADGVSCKEGSSGLFSPEMTGWVRGSSEQDLSRVVGKEYREKFSGGGISQKFTGKTELTGRENLVL